MQPADEVTSRRSGGSFVVPEAPFSRPTGKVIAGEGICPGAGLKTNCLHYFFGFCNQGCAQVNSHGALLHRATLVKFGQGAYLPAASPPRALQPAKQKIALWYSQVLAFEVIDHVVLGSASGVDSKRWMYLRAENNGRAPQRTVGNARHHRGWFTLCFARPRFFRSATLGIFTA